MYPVPLLKKNEARGFWGVYATDAAGRVLTVATAAIGNTKESLIEVSEMDSAATGTS